MSALSPCKHVSRKWEHFPRGTYCRTAARFIPICSLKELRSMGLVELGLPKTCDRPCSSLCCPVYLARCTRILLRKLLFCYCCSHRIVWWSDTVYLSSLLYLPKAYYIQGHSCCCVFVRLNCPLIAVAVWAWGLFCFLSYNLLLSFFVTPWLQIGQPFSLNCVLFDVLQAMWASWLWHRKPLAVLCISFLHAGISHFSLNPGFH